MTAFPGVDLPAIYRRKLHANVKQIVCSDLSIKRIFLSGHIRHSFEIPWLCLTQAERDGIADFFKSCRGRYLSNIVFSDPFDDVTYTCRLDQDDLEMTAPDPCYWTGTLKLIEVANWKSPKPPITVFPSTIPVFVPYSQGRRYRTVIETHDDDYEQAYEDFANAAGIEYWMVGGDNMTEDEASALLDAWEGNGGPYLGMTFSEPLLSTIYEAHFAETEIQHTISFGMHSVRTRVEELK